MAKIWRKTEKEKILMPQLLISVTSVDEAKLALPYADIIDLKDPKQGALGALPLGIIKEVVEFVGRQKLVSATIGDLPMDALQIYSAVQAMQATQVDFIKIGFFDTENYQVCLDALAPLVKNGAQLIAVLFSEKKYPAEMIEKICAAGFVGVMLDTAIKNGKTLFDFYSTQASSAFCQDVRRKGLKVGLAGSLNCTHLEVIKQIEPSYVGFRGGVCESQNRIFSLSEEKIRELCKLL